ncbi:MAG: hypothetical protein V4508_26920 [Pseudomonadota bacterium]
MMMGLFAFLTSVGCNSIPLASNQGAQSGNVTIDLEVCKLQVTLPEGGSRDFAFADRPALRSVQIDNPAMYDKWAALNLLEKYWDYEPTLTGSNAGTLRLAVRVRTVDASMEFDPNDLQSFRSSVERLAISQAQAFYSSLKSQGRATINSDAPMGFRSQLIGHGEWIAYERRSSRTEIFVRPLDSTHFVEFIFSYISNSKTDSWVAAASKDIEKILTGVLISRN